MATKRRKTWTENPTLMKTKLIELARKYQIHDLMHHDQMKHEERIKGFMNELGMTVRSINLFKE